MHESWYPCKALPVQRHCGKGKNWGGWVVGWGKIIGASLRHRQVMSQSPPHSLARFAIEAYICG